MVSDPQYNWIYRELVKSPDDVLGALAYVLYKNEKIAYVEQLVRETGQAPNDEALTAFHRMTNLPQRLESYRNQADVLLQEFLENMLAAKLQVMQDEFKQADVVARIDKVEAALLNQVKASESVVSVQIGKVDNQVKTSESVVSALVGKVDTAINANKGIKGWVADLGANLLVNVLTVVVIGLAVVGYASMDRASSSLKEGIDATGKRSLNQPESPASTPPALGKPS